MIRRNKIQNSVCHKLEENMVTMTIPPPTSHSPTSPFSVPNLDREIKFSPSASDTNRGGEGLTSNARKTHKLSSRLVNDRGSVERMQKLLLLLRHASKCPNGNEESTVGPNDGHEMSKTHSCALYSHCRSMKQLWKHITECGHNAGCGNGKSCDFPNCNRSRYALWHYKNCSEGHDCIVCGPVRMLMAKESEAFVSDKAKSQAVFIHEEQGKYSTKRQHPDLKLESNQDVQVRCPLDDRQQLQQGRFLKRQRKISNVEGEHKSETTLLDDETKIKCDQLIEGLLNHQHGWVFSSPVDPVLLNIPDYFDVIKQPMDLGTVEERLTSGNYYKDVQEVRADIMLTFDNAISYNMAGTEVYTMALEMRNQFLADYESIMC